VEILFSLSGRFVLKLLPIEGDHELLGDIFILTGGQNAEDQDADIGVLVVQQGGEHAGRFRILEVLEDGNGVLANGKIGMLNQRRQEVDDLVGS